MTDYLRRGPQFFWQDIAHARHMTPEQLQEWRANPETFRMPDGSKPAPITHRSIDPAHMKQVEEAEKRTRRDTNTR